MRYLKTRWHHSHPDEPLWIYSEFDDDRWETRKVEVFGGGCIGYAGPDGASDGTDLSELPIPTREEIDAIGEFESHEITSDEFERVWAARPLAV